MPINPNFLNQPSNSHVIFGADYPLGAALDRLNRSGGETWWHLVVALEGGQYAIVQFNALTPLVQTVGPDLFYRSLRSLVEDGTIPAARVVDRMEIGTETAKDLAEARQDRVLVVTENGEFFNILFRGEASGSGQTNSVLTIFRQVDNGTQAGMLVNRSARRRRPAEARYIQAEVKPAAGSSDPLPEDTPLVANLSYHLRVRISPPDPAWLLPPEGEVFPDDELPETDTFHHLQVTFFEPHHAPQPQVKTLKLPPTGASQPVSFTFRTLPDRPDFEARIVILYQNRVLQTALLRSSVLPDERSTLDGAGMGLHMLIEAKVRNRLDDLENEKAFDAALVLNHTPSGEPLAQAIAGEIALVISLAGVAPQIASIKNELSVIYNYPERFEDGLWGEASQKLLFRLAIAGNQLHRKLLEFQGFAEHPIFQQDRLQVVTTNVASFLPLEYIYDRKAPRLNLEPTNRLCAKEKAEICLQSGKCECELADESEAVCPLGFWGMRKVIERFAFKRPPDGQTLQGETFKVYAGINGGRAELSPFQRVIYAASQKVDEDPNHPNQIQSVLDALQQVSQNQTQKVDDWANWRRQVSQDQPTLLVLLPHHTIHPDFSSVHGLEIGNEQLLYDTEMDDGDVYSPGSSLRPVVFLLGCETMATENIDESFVATFLSLGAAIVLGTTTSVLGYHAAPVACKIANTMQTILGEGAQSFADVMLRLRRQALLDGYPMVLTLFAYGDAGWELTT